MGSAGGSLSGNKSRQSSQSGLPDWAVPTFQRLLGSAEGWYDQQQPTGDESARFGSNCTIKPSRTLAVRRVSSG